MDIAPFTSSNPPGVPTNLLPTEPFNRRWGWGVTLHAVTPGVIGQGRIQFEVIGTNGAQQTFSANAHGGGAGGSVNVPHNYVAWDGTFRFRARAANQFHTPTGGWQDFWGGWSGWASFEVSAFPPLAPTGLQPTGPQNRNEPITLFWTHQPNLSVNDPQINSHVEFWQGTGARTSVIVPDAANQHTIPAGTFPTEAAVNFRVQTEGGNGAGWSPWSNQASFPLITINPPAAPTNLRPTTPQNRTRIITLEWTHNGGEGAFDPQDGSQVEYWQGTGARTLLEVAFGNRVTLMEGTFEGGANFTFRARTHGQRGGWGLWSGNITVPLITEPPLAPTNLVPEGVTFHMLQEITFSWRHTPNPNDWDSQVDSQLEFWQGSGERQIIHGGTINRAIAPSGTFASTTPVSWRARTQTLRNGWGEWSAVVSFNLRLDPSLAPTLMIPTNLSPENGRNPRGQIFASWLFNPNPDARNDEQADSEARFRQGAGTWHTFNGGIKNQTIIPANFFTSMQNVEWQARTQTVSNGWGAWSGSVVFELRETPPLQPTLIFPVNIPVRAVEGAFLEWGYNSPYDTFPSRFDLRYRVDGGNWTYIRIDAQGDFPAAANARTRAITEQSRVEWQVRAYGENGDMGQWSDIAVFFVIGTPPKPELVRVTNSNRPTIHFSAQMAQAWELEIIQDGQVIYQTGIIPFTGEFTYTLKQFIPNGNYLARLRISNEYGINSEWTTLAFSIAATPPQALELRTANNVEYRTMLWFNGEGRVVYVYRAEIDSNDFTPIAKLKSAKEYEDWTVRPRIRYKYFVRAVNEQFAFADSSVEIAKSDFPETTIADTSAPQDMVMLLRQIGGKPTKNEDFSKEKSLTHFAGREKPVLQVGTHTDRSLSLSFYVSLAERGKLEELAKSGNVLILRDWRLGLIFGTITGGIRAASDGINSCQVSFNFTECDYDLEVEID